MSRYIRFKHYEAIKESVYRRFAFTYNNYTPEGIQRVKNMARACCQFLCYTPEVGAQGTPHLQGYFIVHPHIMLKQVRSMIPGGVYIKPARENTYRNVAYCMKDVDKVASGGVTPYMFVTTFDWQEYADFEENPWRFLWAQSVIGAEKGEPFTNQEWDLYNKYPPIGDIMLDGEP